jgi:putative oxidoreductase
MRPLTATNDTLLGIALLLLRGAVGGILFAAGAGKVFGWFGGMGMEATVESFAAHSGISAPWAYLSTYTELVGGLLLALGLLTRPAAIAVAVNMLVAGILTIPMGFLAVAAYPFSLMASAAAIAVAGPMRYSLDAIIAPPDRTRR